MRVERTTTSTSPEQSLVIFTVVSLKIHQKIALLFLFESSHSFIPRNMMTPADFC